MGRIYTITTENVAVSAAQDLVQVIGAAGKIGKLRRVSVGATDTTLPTAQMMDLRCRFLPATVTNGSGGTSPTPQKVDPGDAAASITAKANSTTPATTGGTAALLQGWGVHIYAGLDYTFPQASQPTVGPSESVTFELLSTLSGTVHLTTTVEVEEIGG
jgi:hypothetical protein